MSYRADNAVILAAGTASRFAPLSHEKPKALIEVRGEVLIERQIRQLREAGIREILAVVGYQKEQFAYLADRFGVELVENPDYLTRNNNASLYAVRERLGNTYVCSSDNYFTENPFERTVHDAYYAAVYAEGPTKEWCLTQDAQGYIDSVTVGGRDAWVMLGHTFWSAPFSRRFVQILEEVYDRPETADLLWESIYLRHLDELKMKLRRYPDGVIFEFDTLDELRAFDESYVGDTRSRLLKKAARELGCGEAQITDVQAVRAAGNAASGFRFQALGRCYEMKYETEEIREV